MPKAKLTADQVIETLTIPLQGDALDDFAKRNESQPQSILEQIVDCKNYTSILYDEWTFRCSVLKKEEILARLDTRIIADVVSRLSSAVSRASSSARSQQVRSIESRCIDEEIDPNTKQRLLDEAELSTEFNGMFQIVMQTAFAKLSERERVAGVTNWDPADSRNLFTNGVLPPEDNPLQTGSINRLRWKGTTKQLSYLLYVLREEKLLGNDRLWADSADLFEREDGRLFNRKELGKNVTEFKDGVKPGRDGKSALPIERAVNAALGAEHSSDEPGLLEDARN